jgi:hypothetical protein
VVRTRTAVVLPAPLRPSRAHTVPVSTSRLTSTRARVEPKERARCSATREQSPCGAYPSSGCDRRGADHRPELAWACREHRVALDCAHRGCRRRGKRPPRSPTWDRASRSVKVDRHVGPRPIDGSGPALPGAGCPRTQRTYRHGASPRGAVHAQATIVSAGARWKLSTSWGKRQSHCRKSEELGIIGQNPLRPWRMKNPVRRPQWWRRAI